MAFANNNGVNRGAGVYGGERGRDTTCPNETPYGHSAACDCHRRARVADGLGDSVQDRAKLDAWLKALPSQAVPYDEDDEERAARLESEEIDRQIDWGREERDFYDL